MTYSLREFITNLEASTLGKPDKVDMQSDEAIDAINDCLPRNMLLARMFETDSPKMFMSEKQLREERGVKAKWPVQ